MEAPHSSFKVQLVRLASKLFGEITKKREPSFLPQPKVNIIYQVLEQSNQS